jgi:hypothetical protein
VNAKNLINNNISKNEMKNEIQDAIKKIEDFDKKLNLNLNKQIKDEEKLRKDVESDKSDINHNDDLNKTEIFLQDKLSATSFFKKVNK